MTNLDTQQELVRTKREELRILEMALKSLCDEKASELCPFNIGDEIEYESNKRGIVDRVYFPYKSWKGALEDQLIEVWAVTGRKINKDGRFGKKDFQEVSNDTHIIDGTSCRSKTLEEYFGIK